MRLAFIETRLRGRPEIPQHSLDGPLWRAETMLGVIPSHGEPFARNNIMCHEPLVSVIIPAYNAAAFVRPAIASALAQTHSNLEVLVVDDGSTDETPQIVEEMARGDKRVRLLRQQNGGVAKARNLAIAHSRGEFIAPLDADDVWMPEKIARQVKAMQEGGPDVGLVYTWWVSINEEGNVSTISAQWTIEGRPLQALVYCNFTGNASVPMFRRACLDRVGGYNWQMRACNAQGCEDWDLALRVTEQYEVRCVPEFLTCYRSVFGSMAKNSAAMARSHQMMLKDVKTRLPDLPPHVYRWSRGVFLWYLVSLSYHDGNYLNALRWARRLLQADPAAATSPWLLTTVSRSFLWLAVRPFTSFIWPDRRSYEEFRKRWIPAYRSNGSTEVPQAEQANAAFSSFSSNWRPALWRPYDRICLRRWQHLTRFTSRHV